MNLATLLRKMQFYAHMGHNLLGGATFFQDHAFLADLYQAYEDAYDGVIERMIGLGEKVDLVKIHQKAVEGLEEPKSFDACFEEILAYEDKLCVAIDKIIEGASQGTANMLQGLADQSEMRQYKLKQRLK